MLQSHWFPREPKGNIQHWGIQETSRESTPISISYRMSSQQRGAFWQRNPVASAEKMVISCLGSHSEWMTDALSSAWLFEDMWLRVPLGIPPKLSLRSTQSKRFTFIICLHSPRPDIMSSIKYYYLHFLLLTQSLPCNKFLISNKTFLYNRWNRAQFSH